MTQCYGSVLYLSCNPGHRIKVLDDFFGLRTARVGEERDECRYEPGNTFLNNCLKNKWSGFGFHVSRSWFLIADIEI